MRYILNIKTSLLFTFILLATVSSYCQLNKIDSLLQSNVQQDKFSGSVLIARNGNIIYAKSFGFADRDRKMTNDGNVPSSIASVGKIFTATIIMKLAEQEKLRLNDPITKHLPDINLPVKNHITIEHLLTHTSGLGNYMTHPRYQEIISKKNIQLDDIIPLITSLPLVFDEPGLRFEYSNSGFILLGKIIEVITKEKYADVLEKMILTPIKLKDTHYNIDRTQMNGLAIGYRKNNPHANWEATTTYFPQPLSDGGLFTTTKDLLAFDRALFAGKIIKKESLANMMKTHTDGNQPGIGKILYGYGMMRVEFPNGFFSVGHNGGSPGYGTEFRHYQTTDGTTYTLVIQANYDRVIRPIFFEIQDMIVGEKLKR